MLKIKLQKRGAKNALFYRIVAIEKKSKMSGKIVDNLGYWDPSNKKVLIDKDLLKKHVDNGAQLTIAVKKLLES
jgi:small subunit ribosomal protein S16